MFTKKRKETSTFIGALILFPYLPHNFHRQNLGCPNSNKSMINYSHIINSTQTMIVCFGEMMHCVRVKLRLALKIAKNR